MADIPAVAGRRAPRNAKVEKPPPLKRSVSEEVTNSYTDNNTKIAFQGVRAPRRANLKKPLPRSNSTPQEVGDHSFNQPCDETQYNGMSPNTAKKTTDCLISNVLSHLELQDKLEKVKPNFRTQMSVDSGVGDCNNNSFSSSLCIGRKDSINEVLFDDGFNEYPDDILTIEEELASLVDSSTDTESVSERDATDRIIQHTVIKQGLPKFVIEPSVPCSVIGPYIPIIHRRRRIVIEREPISPTTVLLRDQHDMTDDILTANGRRRMFHLYHNSCADDTSDDVCRQRIQYSAEDLLEIGTSPLSKRPIEGWEYLIHILPQVCFPRVDKYFDTASYRQERDYVMECANVVGPKSTHLQSDPTTFGRHPLKTPAFPFTDRPPTTLRPRNGFGTPFKNNFTREPQLDIQSSEEIPNQVSSTSTNPQIKTACTDPQGLFKNHSTPSENHSKPTEIHSKPSEIHPKPSENHSKPSENHSKPSENHPKPSENHSHIQKNTFIDPPPTKFEERVSSSHNTPSKKRKGDLRMNASSVDLDTKCDISVKWVSGAIKLFANARQDLKKSREKLSSHKPDTIQLPTQVDGSGCSTNPGPSNSPMKHNRQRYYEEDYYFNADLPEKCPW